MKTRENKAMRFASVLLVLTLLATSLTAGTFAKYATEKSGSETARVAKFGVDVAVNTDNLFGKNYLASGGTVTTETDDNTISVKSSNEEKVLAPGTTGFMTFSATGTPETDVKLTITVKNQNDKRVKLTTGSYTNGEESVTVSDGDYYPIKWTLKKENIEISECKGTSLEAINSYLEKQTITSEAGTDLATQFTYTLSWEWAYDDASVTNDGADTILGDLAADKDTTDIKKGEAAIGAADYSLNEAIEFSISVEQVD